MNNQELSAYRKKIIDDAIHFRKPDKVPHISNYFNWVIFESGLGLTEAYDNPELLSKAQKEMAHKYKFDLMNNALMLGAQPKCMLKYTGPGYYRYHDDTGVVDLADVNVLSFDEFEAYMDNPEKYTWETILPRKFSNWKNMTVKDMLGTVTEYNRYFAALMDVENYWHNECGYPAKYAPVDPIMLGIEELMCNFTGMKATSIELRRNPARVKAICDYFDNKILERIKTLTAKSIPNRENTVFDLYIGMLGYSFLSTRQFEQFYWPTLKKVFDRLHEENLTAFVLCEGSVIRFAEYFNEIPKGIITLQIELDDPYELRKAMPNVCISGGLTTHLLGSGAPDQCVQKAKQLMDDLGRDGGFILSQNKMMSFLSDTKPENLKAVCDFTSTYRP